MLRKLSVVFSSHLTEQDNEDFKKHVNETCGISDLYVHCIVNMGDMSLPEAYNSAWNKLKEMGRADGGIVFCHNDIVFKTQNWGKLLLGMFSNYDVDIVGVAGTTELNSHGCWWMDGNAAMFKRNTKMYGRVWHLQGLSREEESVYSDKIMGIKNTVIVDGLFIGVNGSVVGELEEEMFDERFRGFHFYDISFCFRNYLNGFNLGVTDKISIMHKSIGMTNQQWEMNRLQFTLLYKEELPVTI